MVILQLLLAGGLAAPAAAAEEGDAERGEYVATLADCGSCHTGDHGTYAGGEALATPFGDIYPPNITPHPEAGIGEWSQTDFATALRDGVRPDGLPIYPAMPYQHYAKMTDEDLRDLWAHLRSVDASGRETPANELAFPFNVRSSLHAWQALYLNGGTLEPDADRSDQWNRGRYLVEVLGHCGSCHTPRNALFAALPDQSLEGAKIPGQPWYAPNIGGGAESVIADWSVRDLEVYLAGDARPGESGEAIAGPMRQVIHNSLSEAKQEDLAAMAVYLKGQPGEDGEDEVPSEPTVEAVVTEQNSSLYERHCRSCHGEDGRGEPGVAADLRRSSTVEAREAWSAVSVVTMGVDASENYPRMPGFADALNDAEIAAVTDHVRARWAGRKVPPASPKMSAAARAAMEDGPVEIVCPRVADELMSSDMRDRIAELDPDEPDPERLDALVAEWREEHPDRNVGDMVTAFSAGWCRAADLSGIDATRRARGWVVFAAAVADAAR